MNSVERIKQDVSILDFASRYVPLKKIASTKGGEYAAPCPLCGGKDRFRVQPDQDRWFCRQCNPEWHDVIDLCEQIHGVDFKGALKILGGDDTEKPITKKAIKADPIKRERDHTLWEKRAGEFADECHRVLMSDDGKVAKEYLEGRGINADSMEAWNLGYNPLPIHEDGSLWGSTVAAVNIPRGISIPCRPDRLRYIKIRQRKGKLPKYQMVADSTSWLFGAETFYFCNDAFIFEGEFDAILAWQHWQGDGISFGSFPANHKFSLDWARYLLPIERILLVHDMDKEGQKSAAALAKVSKRVKVLKLPHGNDLTDYYQGGGDVLEFLYEGLKNE